MTQINQIYQCPICGNIVEVLHTGVGELVCCGQPMKLLVGKNQDEGLEKHLPVVENIGDQIVVKIGSIPHPMEEKHYIEWIELIVDSRIYRQFLKPGDEPKAIFKIKADKIQTRAFCNIHGLWQSK
jgi:superoxide reductase